MSAENIEKVTTEKQGAGWKVGDGTPGPGRKKGVPNKVTQEFRKTVQDLLDDNKDNVSRWLTEVAADSPAKALDLLSKLAEYASPKLARTEVSGLNGQALEVVHKVELVSGNGSNPPSA